MEASSVIAVILAGGQGTRIRHLLPELPKPMAPVRGRPFLEWIVRYLAQQGITQIVISTGYRAEIIASHFAACRFPGVEISCVRETESLGTAGGFLHTAASTTKAPPAWLVLNGDSLVFAQLQPLLKSLQDPQTDGALLGLSMDDASRYGTLSLGPTSQLLTFAEKRPGAGLINAGVYLLRHSLLNRFPSQKPLAFETQVFPQLLREGALLQVESVNAPFLDIGTPETLFAAGKFIQENISFGIDLEPQI